MFVVVVVAQDGCGVIDEYSFHGCEGFGRTNVKDHPVSMKGSCPSSRRPVSRETLGPVVQCVPVRHHPRP